jgi:hypothetical protein
MSNVPQAIQNLLTFINNDHLDPILYIAPVFKEYRDNRSALILAVSAAYDKSEAEAKVIIDDLEKDLINSFIIGAISGVLTDLPNQLFEHGIDPAKFRQEAQAFVETMRAQMTDAYRGLIALPDAHLSVEITSITNAAALEPKSIIV